MNLTAKLVLKGGELELVGPMSLVTVTRLPVLTVSWYDEHRADTPATDVLIAPNGRPLAPIMRAGHGKGRRPGNHGKSYPAEPLSNGEALELLRVIPQTQKTGVRNRALLTLLWRTGLRISEALDLLPHHVDYGTKRVTVLHGKGDKRRTVGIDDGALMALQPWLIERAMLGISPRSPLFCTTQLPGRGRRIHPNYVRAVLHEYGRRAEIPKRVHPHGFRHTLACDLIREGFSIVNVQTQLGHSNVATTAGYLRGLGADETFEKVADRVMPGGAA
jgi:site-specific recombinase XerD